MRIDTPLPLSIASLALGALTLTACGGQGAAPGQNPTEPASAAPTSTSIADPGAGGNEREVGTVKARLLMAHADGLTLLDAGTGKVLKETEHSAFLRLNNAGDGRHVFVTDSDTFRLYDTGISSQPHGDHKHNFETDPGLTEVTYDMPHAGHVVLHHGRTVLFADGDGTILGMDSDKVADTGRGPTRYKADAAHHGVAMELADGSLLTTQGTKDARTTIQNKKGAKVLSETKDCPGIHGEAAAESDGDGDVVVFGCENGPVVFRDGAFHKVPVKDAYSRSGNLAGSDASPIVLGDYKVDKDAEQERPTRVALIDTRNDSLKLVDLGSPYWFRSLARGPEGEGLVLTYDGSLRVIDEEKGTQTASIKVIEPWQEKKDWQEPGPAIKVAGDKAYVTDAEKKKLHVVDLHKKAVSNTYDLPHTPVEIAVTTGEAENPAKSADGHGHEGEGHEGHDH